MSQSAKPFSPQETSRRGRAAPVAVDAMGLADAGLRRAGFSDPTLVLRWSAIVGPEIARVAEPVKYQEEPNGAALTLRCEAAASVFLQHETRALIEKLNAYLGPGRITRIRLVPGQLAPPPTLPEHPPQFISQPGHGSEKAELSDGLSRLAALRRSLKK
jgi:hypothetical protein